MAREKLSDSGGGVSQDGDSAGGVSRGGNVVGVRVVASCSVCIGVEISMGAGLLALAGTFVTAPSIGLSGTFCIRQATCTAISTTSKQQHLEVIASNCVFASGHRWPHSIELSRLVTYGSKKNYRYSRWIRLKSIIKLIRACIN